MTVSDREVSLVVGAIAEAREMGRREGAKRRRHDIRKNERRRCVRWLHDRASQMNDPKAQAVLNSAAFSLGLTIADVPAPKPGGGE